MSESGGRIGAMLVNSEAEKGDEAVAGFLRTEELKGMKSAGTTAGHSDRLDFAKKL